MAMSSGNSDRRLSQLEMLASAQLPKSANLMNYNQQLVKNSSATSFYHQRPSDSDLRVTLHQRPSDADVRTGFHSQRMSDMDTMTHGANAATSGNPTIVFNSRRPELLDPHATTTFAVVGAIAKSPKMERSIAAATNSMVIGGTGATARKTPSMSKQRRSSNKVEKLKKKRISQASDSVRRYLFMTHSNLITFIFY